jgi:hypothetical protein
MNPLSKQPVAALERTDKVAADPRPLNHAFAALKRGYPDDQRERS